MLTAVEEMTTPKKKNQPKDDRSGRQTAPVQLPKELARMVATIASHDGISQGELITPILYGPIKMHYERVLREMQELARRTDSPK